MLFKHLNKFQDLIAYFFIYYLGHDLKVKIHQI